MQATPVTTVLMILGVPVALCIAAFLLFVAFACLYTGPSALWLLVPVYGWGLNRDGEWRIATSAQVQNNRCKVCKTTTKGSWATRAWVYCRPFWAWHLRPWGPCAKAWEAHKRTLEFAVKFQRAYKRGTLSKEAIKEGRAKGWLPSREQELTESGLLRERGE